MFLLEFALGLGWRTWLYTGIIAVALGAAAWFTHDIYVQGYNASQKAITDANKKAMDDANAAQKDVDACFASGRTWDRASQQCM